MSISKVAPFSEASAVAQASAAVQFANYFSNLAGQIESGQLAGSRRALAELLKASAYADASGIEPLNQSTTFRAAFNAIRNAVRAGDMDEAKATLSNLRQTFGSPVNTVAGTDLRSMKTSSNGVSGTDLRAINTSPGSIAGTDFRTIKTTSGSIAGTDFRSIDISGASKGSIAGTDFRTIKTTSGSIAGTDFRSIEVNAGSGSSNSLKPNPPAI